MIAMGPERGGRRAGPVLTALEPTDVHAVTHARIVAASPSSRAATRDPMRSACGDLRPPATAWPPSLFVHLVEDLVLTALADEPVVAEGLFQRQPGEERDDGDQARDGHVVPLGNDGEEVFPLHGLILRARR